MSTPNIKSAIARLTGLLPVGPKGSDINAQKVGQSLPAHEHGEISSSTILDHLPTFTSALDKMGNWQPLAHGSCRYFQTIQTRNFGQWVGDSVHVQDRVAVLKAVSDCRTGKKETNVDFRLLNNAGRQNIPVWLEIRCTPVENSEKILTILRDISDTKSMQNEIVEARDWADKANTAKTRFLANMSHELRTPLNAIIGFSEILRSGMVPVNEVEKQQEYQGLINDSAQHLLHVLNDILDMSKIESGKYEIFPEKFDLVKVVHSVCAMLMPLAQKVDVKFNIEEPLDSFQIEADSKAVRQILINILSNAIKFTNPDTCIDIGVVRTGRSIEIMVRDYGNGISPECIDGLGQPFHQVDANKTRRHQGTGLGLSIVKGLIELHQGSINIESEVGHGTTVTVQLSQYQKISPPVPADAADSVIKINPQPGHSEMSQPAISRLVG